MYNTKYNTNELPEHKVIPFLVEGDFYFALGVRAFRRRDFDKAIKWVERATELSPKNALFLCQLSVIYTETGSYHKANQILTMVIDQFGEAYVDCYYLIANNYAHLGLFQDAEKNALLYLEKAPDGEFKKETENLLQIVGMYHEEEFDEEDESLLFDDEDELMIYQETAFYHMEHQNFEQALPILEEMMTLFPDYKPAKHEFAYSLFFSGDRQEAIELEEQWFEMEPDSIQSIRNLAIFYHLNGELEKSGPHIQLLKTVYPMHEQQKLKLAIAFAQLDQNQEALTRFQRLVKGKLLGHLTYFKWYSYVVYRTGDMQKAKELWEEGCRRHPTLSEQVSPFEKDS